MKHFRWYDNYPALKELIAVLESLDSQTIDLLAQDFIQIIMDNGFASADSTIDLVNKNSPDKYNRWYDKNYNLHTCIELLKSLPDEKKEILIKSLQESIFQLITDIYYEKEK